MASQQRKCEADGCGAWTQGMARVGGHVSFVLCDEHRNRENVEKLYSVGESWTS
jgi:hypothetical protein